MRDKISVFGYKKFRRTFESNSIFARTFGGAFNDCSAEKRQEKVMKDK